MPWRAGLGRLGWEERTLGAPVVHDADLVRHGEGDQIAQRHEDEYRGNHGQGRALNIESSDLRLESLLGTYPCDPVLIIHTIPILWPRM